MSMRPALLLVDMQQDYLSRPGLVPPPVQVLENASRLLAASRAAGIPVFHSHTVVRADGTNRMPHWKRHGTWSCVEGTEGFKTPAAVSPLPAEPVFAKPFFSAFGNPQLADALASQNISHLVVAGLYTHACVQATVLDAYQAGYEVWVAEDAVASYDALHAALSRQYLGARACRFAPVDRICAELGMPDAARDISASSLPAARAGGEWLPSAGLPLWPRHDPANWENCAVRVPLASRNEVAAAVVSAGKAQAAWASRPAEERASRIRDWAGILEERKEEFIQLLAQEIGKPLKESRDELKWAVTLARSVAARIEREKDELIAPGVTSRFRPVGVAGLITPWNNPVAIPAGKLAPALAYGNTVVWKPALQAPQTSLLLLQTMDEAGIPAECVSLVFGDAQTGAALAGHPGIDALAFTGSSVNGQQLAALCAVSGKPLQAELGGNNAVIIMDCSDPVLLARELARSLFSFGGQRCTAPRRLIVARALQAVLKPALVEAIASLRLGYASDPDTDVGPLISREAQQRMQALVAEAVGNGATLLSGGEIPKGMARGCWFSPTLLENLPLNSPVVCEEAFGPVAVWQETEDLEEALGLCNGVRHGLVATLISSDSGCQQRFLEQAEAGILRINQLAGLHPDAPFSGWKASSIGPPEHGAGDRFFYTRMQSVYQANVK
jgi:acyl-CoA reductase-like NAD-dependent aldehyde dehydrogenase/nicotinamidase-related amidase